MFSSQSLDVGNSGEVNFIESDLHGVGVCSLVCLLNNSAILYLSYRCAMDRPGRMNVATLKH